MNRKVKFLNWQVLKNFVSGPLFADEWEHSEASFDPFLIKHFMKYHSNKWSERIIFWERLMNKK